MAFVMTTVKSVAMTELRIRQRGEHQMLRSSSESAVGKWRSFKSLGCCEQATPHRIGAYTNKGDSYGDHNEFI